MHKTRIVNWNINWRRRDSPAGAQILKETFAVDPDIVCLTEGHVDFLPDTGEVITSEADYGYPLKAGRRKVLLWTKTRWENVDLVGSTDLPPGRFVSAATDTPLGRIHVVGVCIPWSQAHVRTGRADRSPWGDHEQYLVALRDVLQRLTPKGRLVVVGDFNQTVPRSRAPRSVFEALSETFKDMSVLTSEPNGCFEKPAIDHIVTSRDLEATAITTLPNNDGAGGRLSDHFGYFGDLSLK